jgi:hypothetical protein
MDLRAFLEARGEAERLVPCLGHVVAPDAAAWFHVVQGLQAFTDNDRERSVGAFAAALDASPDLVLPPEIAPAGHLLHDPFDDAQSAPPAIEVSVRLPRGTDLYVDGRERTSRPLDRSAVVQLVLGQQVWWTRYAPPGALFPELDAAPTPGPSVPLLATSAAAATLSAGLYALALSARSDFWDSTTDYEELDRLRRRTNQASAASAGLALVAAGAGTMAFFGARF